MSVNNDVISTLFQNISDLLEVKGENPFRIRAYRNAARVIRGISETMAEMVEKGEDLTQIPGIGEDLAGKICEIVKTGTLSQLLELEDQMPTGIYDLLKIPGLGPKKIKILYEKLQVGNIEALQYAAEKHQIQNLPGFGKKTEENILKKIIERSEGPERIRRDIAEMIANDYVAYLKHSSDLIKICVCGSYRRGVENVGDIDILASCTETSDIMERFIEYGDIKEVLSKGDTRSAVLLRSGMQVDLRIVPEQSYGAALHYFTGSKAHNIAIGKLAQKKKIKINEYGVFKGDDRIGGENEEEIFSLLDLAYIDPELREDTGEIEMAEKNSLPRLICIEDILGDLHSHTTDSDGHFSIESMVEAGRDKGYKYLAISNHSKSLAIANGLDEKRLMQEIEAIDALQTKFKDFVIIKSIEVDILKDGSLDLPDSILKNLDFTVCSVHSAFNLSKEKQTERIIRAMDNPYFTILGHPTGRLINRRKGYDIDLKRIIEAAKERGCFLELNSHPQRLDLNDVNCRLAKQMGVKVAISTDAHSINDLNYIRMGIEQARRGWLEPKDVLNTYEWEDLKKLLQRSK